MKRYLALASSLLLAATATPTLAERPSTATANTAPQATSANTTRSQERNSNELTRQARQVFAAESTCPDGQQAPGHSASAPGSPFNPNGNAAAHHSDNSHFTNACRERPSSP
jgi:hypothetical protein